MNYLTEINIHVYADPRVIYDSEKIFIMNKILLYALYCYTCQDEKSHDEAVNMAMHANPQRKHCDKVAADFFATWYNAMLRTSHTAPVWVICELYAAFHQFFDIESSMKLSKPKFEFIKCRINTRLKWVLMLVSRDISRLWREHGSDDLIYLRFETLHTSEINPIVCQHVKVSSCLKGNIRILKCRRAAQ